MHCRLLLILLMLLCTACAGGAREDRLPRRSSGLQSGPELIFKRPIHEVVPMLAGAEATGNNGRVGPELAFWSYRLQDGRNVLFHACAELEGVDCERRRQLICRTGRPQAISQQQVSGDVRRLECRYVGMAGAGDLHPGCEDSEFQHMLSIGLSMCL